MNGQQIIWSIETAVTSIFSVRNGVRVDEYPFSGFPGILIPGNPLRSSFIYPNFLGVVSIGFVNMEGVSISSGYNRFFPPDNHVTVDCFGTAIREPITIWVLQALPPPFIFVEYE